MSQGYGARWVIDDSTDGKGDAINDGGSGACGSGGGGDQWKVWPTGGVSHPAEDRKPSRALARSAAIIDELMYGVEAELRLGYSLKFRGFLEPQMDGGHENKWRH